MFPTQPFLEVFVLHRSEVTLVIYVKMISSNFLIFSTFIVDVCVIGRSYVYDYYTSFNSITILCRCSQCGRESEASSKMEDFYELELNVKGLKSLDESLDDYLTIEELHGDNQYFCESCRTRVDATRSIKLRTLPEVLNFQLKRYVFLPKVLT